MFYLHLISVFHQFPYPYALLFSQMLFKHILITGGTAAGPPRLHSALITQDIGFSLGYNAHP